MVLIDNRLQAIILIITYLKSFSEKMNVRNRFILPEELNRLVEASRKTRDLLYCRTCGKRFASTRVTAFFGLHLSDDKIEQIIHHAAEGVGVRATARFLNINKDTVNRVILRTGEHCELILSSLLRSLKLKETQLDELWSFVKKRNVLTNKN